MKTILIAKTASDDRGGVNQKMFFPNFMNAYILQNKQNKPYLCNIHSPNSNIIESYI